MDPPLKLMLVPNRLFRVSDCKSGHPLETALVVHCGDGDFQVEPASPSAPRLRMTRGGRLVEEENPTEPSSSSSFGKGVDAAEVARLKLVDMNLWLLAPEWRQHFDLIQARVNRLASTTSSTTAAATARAQPMTIAQHREWLNDVTVWEMPYPTADDDDNGGGGGKGAASGELESEEERRKRRKRKKRQKQRAAAGSTSNPLISSHNIKRHCKKAALAGKILCGLGGEERS